MKLWFDSQGITSDMDMAVAGLKNDGTPDPEWGAIQGDGTGPTGE